MRKPSEDGSTEFKTVSDGWHRVTFADGIQPNVKKDEQSGKESKTLMIPYFVDEDSEDNGWKGALYPPWDMATGEQRIADILNAVDLWKAFDEKFPGEVSAFDPKLIAAFIKRVPGNSCMMRFGRQRPPRENWPEVKQIVSIAWAKAHGIELGGGTKRAAVVEEEPAEAGKKDEDGW